MKEGANLESGGITFMGTIGTGDLEAGGKRPVRLASPRDRTFTSKAEKGSRWLFESR